MLGTGQTGNCRWFVMRIMSMQPACQQPNDSSSCLIGQIQAFSIDKLWAVGKLFLQCHLAG